MKRIKHNTLCLLVALCLTLSVGAENVYVEGQARAISSEGVRESEGYIGLIRDDRIPAADVTREQYLVYADATGQAYIGYEFAEPLSVNTMIYTSGIVSEAGGWCKNGDLRMEVRVDGTWIDAGAYMTPAYPVSDLAADHHPTTEYVFNCKPVVADAVRLIGTPGGTDAFLACAELSVLCDVTLDGYDSYEDYSKLNETEETGWIEAICNPIAAETHPDVSGGSQDISVINDGYVPKEGDSFKLQYDTVSSSGKKSPGHQEYIGYIFPAEYMVEKLVFTEGGNFFDGGWFKDGSLTMEIYQNYQWTEVPFTVTPDYPNSDNRDDFLPDFETYTFFLNEPTTCKGIRLCGTAGGSAYFISCGELRVKTVTEEEAAETEAAKIPAETAAPTLEADEPFTTMPKSSTIWLSVAGGAIVIAALVVVLLLKKRRTS